MLNNNNAPKAHCMYTMKYIATILANETVEIISLQLKVQVLTRVPNQWNRFIIGILTIDYRRNNSTLEVVLLH